MSRRLIVDDGRRQRELLLVGSMVVGRDPMCDISEDDLLLSRRHAEFVVSADQVFVRDLGSRNGIFVNGVKTAEGRLRSGDVVQVAYLKLRYVEDDAPLDAVPEIEDLDQTSLLRPPSRSAPVRSTMGSIQRSASSSVFPPASTRVDDDADRTRLTARPSVRPRPDVDSATQIVDRRVVVPHASEPAAPVPSNLSPLGKLASAIKGLVTPRR